MIRTNQEIVAFVNDTLDIPDDAKDVVRESVLTALAVRDIELNSPLKKLYAAFWGDGAAEEQCENRRGLTAAQKGRKYETTCRGFCIYGSLTDEKKSEVRVQESSAAGERCAWIFTEHPDESYQKPCPHLSVQHAGELIELLQRFIVDVESR